MKKPTAYYDFCIDSLTPETLRLGRFVEYVTELRAIFGNAEDVQFSKVRKGSVVLEFRMSQKTSKQVEPRLRLLGGTDMPPDLADHSSKLNALLRRDNASGKLLHKDGPVIVQFPGVRTPLAQEAIVHETSTLDGTVVGVKGIDDTVQVWINTDDGDLHKCNAKREIAKQLAPLWDCYVRLTGKAKWKRGGDRRWTLEEFHIQSFDRLDDTPLVQVIEGIQQLEGNGWNALDDAQAKWRELRAD